MREHAVWLCRTGLVCVVLVLVLGVGCKGKKDVPINPELTVTDEDRDAASTMERTTAEGLPDVELEKLLWDPDTGLKTLYFDYDSYALRPDALVTLRENAEKIKKAPSAMIQIEGHCDERGTQEYNLALGEKRALATREHLIKLGVSGDRLITISYGEEDPVALGHDESAWRLNRRCEFNKAM